MGGVAMIQRFLQDHYQTVSDVLVISGAFGSGFSFGLAWLGSQLHTECPLINGEAIGAVCSTLQSASQIATDMLVMSAAFVLMAMIIQAYYTNSGIFSSLDVATCNNQDTEK
jgi:hypothetical protein